MTGDAMLEPQDWSFPVPIAYGPGRLSELGARLAGMGVARVLIVTDRGSRDLPFIGRLADVLGAAGLESDLYAGFSPNPRDDEVGAGAAMVREGGHDAVIGIGGGSAMDGAKAICLTARSGVDLWDFEFESAVPEVGDAFPVLVTVPTTAGTGAETESTAMITHVDRGMKFCVWHPALKPALAVLDPELTVGLPGTLTAWTGADALTHAIEAYLVPGFHPLCDGLALEGLRLVARWLPVAVAEPGNMAARGGMLVGSCLAGIAFLKGLGLVHAISHMVGAEYDTQHGLTNAVILPVVLRYNLAEGREAGKVARMAEAMGLSGRDEGALIAGVERMLDGIGIPRSLAEIGVPEDCAARIAAKAVQDSAAGTNPREAGVAEVEALVREAIRGAR
ncbi:iron-containing alcohol dehydrogenase [Roseovarius sp. SCSIO 43702]|uniref:iron-containing alcohol dehydrogenase n=1 Tax=Roseovarius sp. SCSIO 43702 TaxID=2823043 RepID=UPI001C737A5C|nr:iron-containing alcohol dehydrogenase [Roseovarius sp. SCSIO 43702]QYX58174.1 iron-containing alcohol dehydrogenase [Roseovarius sp. SCSIO 43702]